ncbi:four-carbon acid sugar kinase family protein [Nocardioides sp. GY 10127]|uniref:four-carbon acid sugar kinase family protein n=1 Tax=Nocardioides sp. GY 10127 TaxID=2569762 RepID=UPI0010A84E5A|nr:four-carbon acid sugar kinase family protein [Nocardioides sp. GY 10127]TIC79985.1 hypothetical protein E8D37_15205 [Nocardioides sp. GY 10127]
MTTITEVLAGHAPSPTTSAAEVEARAEKAPVLVVLDDDPTGTQPVAGLPVLTRWAEEDLAWAFAQQVPAVYVLTNTRSLDPDAAAERNREVARAARAAAATTGVQVVFVSRGDSTLRGHFPLETDTLVGEVAAELTTASGATLEGHAVDAVLLVPAFPDAGRVTVDGVHYYVTDGEAVPVGETEFAKDATFGYSSSDLRDWVAETTGGRYAAAEVACVDLRTIREGGPEAVASLLESVTGGLPVAVDAVTEEDLRVVALGVLLAQEHGHTFVHRVGPTFVRALIGLEPPAPLDPDTVYGAEGGNPTGGLVVVGSHVALTTRQLADLQASDVEQDVVELEVPQVLDPARRDAHVADVVERVRVGLRTGTVVLHTSRALVRVEDGAASLDLSRQVSAALVQVVRTIVDEGVGGEAGTAGPRFVIAKGGITSSDTATHGLGMSRAMVRGPMLPGIVSLWQPMDGPGLGTPYVVFAGNVGGDTSLTDVVRTLTRGATR